jgi:hypothetical protein
MAYGHPLCCGGLRQFVASSPLLSAESGSISFRTTSPPPVASQHALRQRSYFQLHLWSRPEATQLSRADSVRSRSHYDRHPCLSSAVLLPVPKDAALPNRAPALKGLNKPARGNATGLGHIMNLAL